MMTSNLLKRNLNLGKYLFPLVALSLVLSAYLLAKGVGGNYLFPGLMIAGVIMAIIPHLKSMDAPRNGFKRIENWVGLGMVAFAILLALKPVQGFWMSFGQQLLF